MIKLINFDVVTKFHLGISKSVDIFLFHNEDMCDKYCVPKNFYFGTSFVKNYV